MSKGYRAPHGRRPGASTSPGFRTGQGIEALAARGDALAASPSSTQEQRDRAAIIRQREQRDLTAIIRRRARDDDDARMLLGMCGLLEVPGE